LGSPSELGPVAWKELSPPPSVVVAESWGRGDGGGRGVPSERAIPLPAARVGGGVFAGGGEERGAGDGGRSGEAWAGGIRSASPSGPSVPFLYRWTKGDPELSSSTVITVVGAFTNRFLFLSPLVSRPSAGATEMGEARIGSAIASTSEGVSAARRLLARASSLCRLSLS